MTGIPMKREFRHGQTQREDQVKTQRKDNHLKAKERGPRRSCPCQHLGVELAASRARRNKFLFSKSPSL
jgi:hypothetical protein